MSKIKDLKNNSVYHVNLVDIGTIICGEKKIKYLELFLKLYQNSILIEDKLRKVRFFYFEKYNIPMELLTQLRPIDLLLMGLLDEENLISFQKFCEYNEQKLITQNDITKYNRFEDLLDPIKEAEIKITNKQLEKQIKILYEDEEWVILRPLTLLASRKYGANTKWCTSSETNDDHFNRYASKGILIYCINKKTNNKVGVHKFLESQPEGVYLTFWNQLDKRIDSLESGLPYNIINIIKFEIQTYPIPNIIENKAKSTSDEIDDDDIDDDDQNHTQTQNDSLPYMWQNDIINEFMTNMSKDAYSGFYNFMMDGDKKDITVKRIKDLTDE